MFHGFGGIFRPTSSESVGVQKGIGLNTKCQSGTGKFQPGRRSLDSSHVATGLVAPKASLLSKNDGGP